MHLTSLVTASAIIASLASIVSADRYMLSSFTDAFDLNSRGKSAYTTAKEPAFHAFISPHPSYPGLVRMYELHSYATGDFLYTTNKVEVDAIAPPGQTCKAGDCNPWSIGIERIFVFPVQQTGTVPLFRFYNPRTGYHYFSGDYNEGINRGFDPEGIAGHVFPYPAEGSTLFWRWSGPDANFG